MTILLREETHLIFGFIKSLNGLGALHLLVRMIGNLVALLRIAGIYLMVDPYRTLVI